MRVYGTAPIPGASFTWPRDTWNALNRAARVGRPTGRARWRLAPPFNYGGLRITAGEPRLPWGRSRHARSYLTHMPVAILFAWRKGALAGHVVVWKCGARTAYFMLLDEPNSPICGMCRYRAGLVE
jgi:hypothetical protein